MLFIIMKLSVSAKTVRNDNSSRFGKLMKLHFNDQGRMLGASLKTYLLAKSRVCHVPPQEKNYHVFYWLCRGAVILIFQDISFSSGAWPNEREMWNLRTQSEYRYLGNSLILSFLPLKFPTDSKSSNEGSSQFQELRNSMESVGISRTTQQSIFRVLAAILTLGNITFCTGRRADGVDDVTVFSMDDEVRSAYRLLGREFYIHWW